MTPEPLAPSDCNLGANCSDDRNMCVCSSCEKNASGDIYTCVASVDQPETRGDECIQSFSECYSNVDGDDDCCPGASCSRLNPLADRGFCVPEVVDYDKVEEMLDILKAEAVTGLQSCGSSFDECGADN